MSDRLSFTVDSRYEIHPVPRVNVCLLAKVYFLSIRNTKPYIGENVFLSESCVSVRTNRFRALEHKTLYFQDSEGPSLAN